MNLAVGLLLMVVGGYMAGDAWLFGAALGCFMGWLFSAVGTLRGRLDDLEGELARIRLESRQLTAQLAAQRDQISAQLNAAQAFSATAPTTFEPAADPDPQVPATPAPARQVPPPLSAPPMPSRSAAEVPPLSAVAASHDTSASPSTQAPTWDVRLFEQAKRWLIEGNVPVKVGVVVLFFGVAALLRYAYVQGFFTFPIEYRLGLIAALACVALGFGWRERLVKPAFGLSLQGGALGTLMLTVFAAYRYFDVLPPGISFGLTVVLVGTAVTLAVLQNARSLAVLGLLGGYLAPVLISTGSGNHVALFGYYAVLNAAVFAVAWTKSWRALNLMGFVFTFGVGAAWGAKYYTPEYLGTVEPFLILFFLFYVAIGLLYVFKQTAHRRPWVDGTLVFGTPLLAFSMQAKLLAGNRLGLALSAVVVSLIYGALAYVVHVRKSERLLAEAYSALAIAFATLAVPFAFSANTTATAWALEGVGITWLGLRQTRMLPTAAGVLLQLFAAASFFASFSHEPSVSHHVEQFILNPHYLGAAILALSGFMLSLVFDRLGSNQLRSLASRPLFWWGGAWWFGAMFHDLFAAILPVSTWHYAVLYIAATIGIAAGLCARLRWASMGLLAACLTIVGAPAFVIMAHDRFGAPLGMTTWAYWAAFLASAGYALRHEARGESANSSSATSPGRPMHLALLWSVALALTLQLHDYLGNQWHVAQGWYAPAVCLPLVLMTMGLWRWPSAFAWPMHERFSHYSAGWFVPAFALLGSAAAIGLFLDGNAAPLIYVPLFNPLELSLLAAATFFTAYLKRERPDEASMLKIWPYVGLVFITMAILRAVHHLHGEPWSAAILESAFTQASLTIGWSLSGVASMVLGSRRKDRKQWLSGSLLMVGVIGKMVLIDRNYMGNMPGIVSCLAVGLLLVAVGYFAPQPPAKNVAA